MKSKDHVLLSFQHQSHRTREPAGRSRASISHPSCVLTRRHPAAWSQLHLSCLVKTQSELPRFILRVVPGHSGQAILLTGRLNLQAVTVTVISPDHILVMMPTREKKKKRNPPPPETYKLITTTVSKTNEILLSVCGCLEAHLIAGLTDY